MVVDLDRNTYIFFRNSSMAQLGKMKFLKSADFPFLEDVNFTTLDSFIENQVEVFWNLIYEDTLKPLKISMNASLYVLCKIIDERRMFDGFFSAINSKDFFLAMSIYNIMMKSAESGIPVTEISPILKRFKLGMRKGDTYDDLQTVIDEYRSVLNKSGVVDMPMILEIYERLLNEDVYKKHLSKMNFYMAGNIYEDRAKYEMMKSVGAASYSRDFFVLDDVFFQKIDLCFEKKELREFFADDVIEEGKYDSANICDMRRGMDIASLDDFSFSGNHHVIDSDNYFDMLSELEKLICSLVDEGVSQRDIALIFPRINSSVESVFERLKNTNGIFIEKISDKGRVQLSESAVACITALAAARGYGGISDDDKVVFVRTVIDGLKRAGNEEILGRSPDEIMSNNLFIRRNLNSLMKDILDSGKVLPDITKGEGAFLKSFYRSFCEVDERGVKEISHICDIFREISMLESESFKITDGRKIDFVRDYVSTYTPVRRRIEHAQSDKIAAFTYREYISSGMDRKVKIIFDGFSPSYDDRIEDEIGTEIAYLGEDVLSKIPSDSSTGEVSRSELIRLSENIAKSGIGKNISRLMGADSKDSRVYIMTSAVSIGGFDQENKFFDILIESLYNGGKK